MPFPNELHITFLNLTNRPQFWQYESMFLEYIENLCLFMQKYLYERYQLQVRAWPYMPADSVKTYEELQLYDKTGWRDQYFGRQFQFYIGYGLDLKPHPELTQAPPYNGNADGYCECKGRPFLKPEDMMYADMAEYDPRFARTPYEWWGDVSRRITHEMDHQVLYLQNDPGFVTKVHKAKNLPLVRWDMRCTDKQGKPVCFYSQQDPRKV